MSEVVTLLWGGQEFGDFCIEDLDSPELGAALLSVAQFHLNWSEQERLIPPDVKEQLSAMVDPSPTDSSEYMGGTPLPRNWWTRRTRNSYIAHSSRGKQPVIGVRVNGYEPRLNIQQVNYVMPPNLVSGRSKITTSMIESAARQLEQEELGTRLLRGTE